MRDEVAEHPLSASPIVGKTVELTGRKCDSAEFPLELSLNAVEMNGRTQYIGSIRDQTERQRMRAMLAHTDKLASIGLLSAGVAHEINNPLAYVQNNLAVLQRDTKGLLDMVKLYELSFGLLERSDPEAGRRIEELAEEIDWPYIRDNLDQMIDRTRTGVKRVASIVEKMRGLARDRASAMGRSVSCRPDRERPGDDAGPAQAPACRGFRADSRHDADRLRARSDRPGVAQSADQRPSGGSRARDARKGARSRSTPGTWVRGSRSRSPTTARGSTPNIAAGSLIRSSQPNQWARAPDLAWRSAMASSPATEAGSRWKASPAREPASEYCYLRRPYSNPSRPSHSPSLPAYPA